MIKISGKLIILLFAVSNLGIATAQPKIVLKLDDIGASKNTSKAIPVMEYLVQKQIKASYGIIAKRLDSTALDVLGKYINATNTKGEKLIELWHHGLDHTNKNPPDNNMEFKGTSYEFQKAHFDSADMLVKKYLHVQMHTFGSPYNATDSVTARVINENPNYNLVIFSGANATVSRKITFLSNRVDMEKGTGNPDYDFFVSEYEKHGSYQNSCMVLQGHPPQWNDKQFDQFTRIIRFLIDKKCHFVLPHELVK